MSCGELTKDLKLTGREIWRNMWVRICLCKERKK